MRFFILAVLVLGIHQSSFAEDFNMEHYSLHPSPDFTPTHCDVVRRLHLGMAPLTNLYYAFLTNEVEGECELTVEENYRDYRLTHFKDDCRADHYKGKNNNGTASIEIVDNTFNNCGQVLANIIVKETNEKGETSTYYKK